MPKIEDFKTFVEFSFVVPSLNVSSFLGQCSVLSELSIITFDGNNIALYNMASYILVKLPGEIIVAHIEKCPTNRVRCLHAITSSITLVMLNSFGTSV